jgi:hypothetical protein
VGSLSLYNNISGGNNTAVGAAAMYRKTRGNNTAVGTDALANNSSFPLQKKSLTQMKSRKSGLIAEEVEKLDPDLVAHDEDGTLTTIRYEAMNAMLLNEFLKEHRKVQTLEGMIAQQQLQIETLTAAVQKVAIGLNWWKTHPRRSLRVSKVSVGLVSRVKRSRR